MSGVHGNHGHHQHTHGLGLGHHHGTGKHSAQGDQGKQAAPPASAPAAKAPAAAPAAAHQPSMDTAMQALDQAIQGLAANFHKDSFNGQQAPAGVTPAASTLTSPVANLNKDVFLNTAGASGTAGATPVDSTTLKAGDPLLDLKGGGGPSGGVNGDFLRQLGGGGPSGGVNGDLR